MYSCDNFKLSQLEKQRVSVDAAMKIAEQTPNPTVEVPFRLYPEIVKELEEAGWKTMPVFEYVKGNEKFCFTHVYPTEIWYQEREKRQQQMSENKQ